jgi:uncharacterized integral membrane protein
MFNKVFVHHMTNPITYMFDKTGNVRINGIRRHIDMIYLLPAIGLTPGGSSTAHIYTQTIHRTTQLKTLVGRLSGIRARSGQTKINN